MTEEEYAKVYKLVQGYDPEPWQINSFLEADGNDRFNPHTKIDIMDHLIQICGDQRCRDLNKRSGEYSKIIGEFANRIAYYSELQKQMSEDVTLIRETQRLWENRDHVAV